MKKAILIFTLVVVSTQVFPQNKVRGSYKGKEIQIDYYSGQPADIIRVEYELVNDLNREITVLKSQRERLDQRLRQLQEENIQLRSSSNRADSKQSKIVDSLRLQMNRERDEIARQKLLLTEKEQELEKMKNERILLLQRIDSLQKENLRLTNQASASFYYDQKKYYPGSVNATVGLGGPFLFSNLLSHDFWERGLNIMQQYSVYYESPQINPTLPLSLQIGVGISHYRIERYFAHYEETINGLVDMDQDSYDAICSYYNVREKLSLLYLDIPLSMVWGKPNPSKVSFWGKLGLNFSFNVQSQFTGEGTHSISGYYPAWDIVLYDIPELSFAQNKKSYSGVRYNPRTFVLWGTLSGGIYIPLYAGGKKRLSSSWLLKMGLKCNYSLTKISDGQQAALLEGSNYHIGQSNILGGTKTRILSLGAEVGIMYIFKSNH